MKNENKILTGNSLKVLKTIDTESVDMVYMDPPFFTQRKHSLKNKDNSKEYEFDDKWSDINEYIDFIKNILIESKRVLKNTGNIFVHCDKTASHYIRVALDEVFSITNFKSEIIWSYKRWSNAKKGLLNSHQNIYFYSKTKDFKFNTLYTDYSPTTNIDQILQDRERDENGKSKYKTDENGKVILGKAKKGVPMSDTWEIPYLNPKAKERTGYPTQKPVLLLNRILEISTSEKDLVLDPFCGSGTTCVSAKILNRKYIGIDKSKDATELTEKRLVDLIVSSSALLENGSNSYIEKDEKELAILKSIDAVPVQRNNGIDGFLKRNIKNKPVPVRIQKPYETIEEAISKLENSTQAKNSDIRILIQTNELNALFGVNSNVIIVKANELEINKHISLHLS